jgi:hypothetical protein
MTKRCIPVQATGLISGGMSKHAGFMSVADVQSGG